MTRRDPSPLDALRSELDRLDQELLDTAARRLEVARRIGALKAGDDRALFDRARERAVLERARANATARGLPATLGEALVGALIEAGHHAQADILAARSPAARAICVVGGAGRMGRLFGGWFQALGHRVSSWEPGDPTPLAEAVAEADITVIAAPMAQAVEVAREAAPHVRPDALICDLNSLKSEICEVFATQVRGQAVGLHPMFGPTVAHARRQKIVVCAVREGDRVSELLADLGRLGAELVHATPEAHDRAMAVVQVLVHFRTLVMGRALADSGLSLEESLRYTSPIYRLELAVVGRLFAQDPALYAAIEMDNPAGAAQRARFVAAARELADQLDRGDVAAFTEGFRASAAWFGDFSEEAMRLSDAVIGLLAGRA